MDLIGDTNYGTQDQDNGTAHLIEPREQMNLKRRPHTQVTRPRTEDFGGRLMRNLAGQRLK